MSNRFFSWFAVLSALAPLLLAQNPTATLVGTVRDQSGAVLTGADLEVRNTDTGNTRKAVTDPRGEVSVPDLVPGPYAVTITHAGFRTVRQTNIVLEMDQVARMEFKLDVGAVSQSVDVVETSAPLISTDNGTMGEVMAADQIIEMPLNGRSINDLGYLAANITANNTHLDGSSFAINGARPENTNFLIDGFSDREPLHGLVVVQPNLDAMQEFKMQTNNFSAEYGRFAGGVMSMVLKSGSNRYHGTLFEFLRNDAPDARSFFDVTKSELRQNQFGGLISGPVTIPKIYNGHDRTFFLLSWESLREVSGSSALGVLPTAAQQDGNFLAFAPISDPLSTGSCKGSTGKGACFPGGIVPQSRVSPTALAAQQFYPAPNLGGVNNMSSYAVAPSRFDSLILKFDHRLTDKDTLAFRYTDRYGLGGNPYANADVAGSNNTGLFGVTQHNHILLTGLTYTRLFTPALINELRIGYTRSSTRVLGAFSGTDYNTRFGLPVGTSDPAVLGFPLIYPSGYQQLGTANVSPSISWSNSWTLGNTLTWVKGSHLIKAGVDALHTQTIAPYTTNLRGTFNFTGYWTGNSYADFLLGYLNSDGRLVEGSVSHLLDTSYGTFLQDDWKATPNLTLNLGLRYELNKPPIESAGRWGSFNPGLDKVVVASLNSLTGTGIGFTNPNLVETAAQAGYPQSLVYVSRMDFAPRLGFAWRPFGGNKTVIRGGYGLFYGGEVQGATLAWLSDVFPFSLTQSVSRNATNPLVLDFANPFPSPTLINNLTSFEMYGYQLHPPPAYLQSWNFTLEREIGFSSAIKLSYVGSKGTHLGMEDNINEPQNRTAKNPSGISPYPGWGTVEYFNFQGDSTYEGLTLTFQRRFVHHFFYTANYTYSKSLDDDSTPGGASLGGINGLQNTLCLSCDRGRSDWDQGHVFVMNFSWESPAHNLFLRGWQLSGSGRFNTGSPFTPAVTSANVTLGEAIRPNRIGKGTVQNPNPSQWFDVADFPQVPAGAFAYGNSGRNILDGPGMIALNQSLARNFRFKERYQLQMRWEVFNVLNHANFQLPQNAVNAANAGTLTSVISPGRQMQFAARLSF